MIRFEDIRIAECLAELRELSNEPFAYTDEIPDVLEDDFREYTTGKTLSMHKGREISYDIKLYYAKVYYHRGANYKIKWKFETAV